MKRFITTEFTDTEFRELIATTVKEALQQSFTQLIPYLSNNSPPDRKNEKLLSRRDVCQILKISLPTLASIQKQGKLKVTIVGGSYKYSRKNLDDYIKKQSTV